MRKCKLAPVAACIHDVAAACAAYYFGEFSRSVLEENLGWEVVLWRLFGDRSREDVRGRRSA